MDKAAVFIDGGYLNKVLKHVFGEPEIDYELLSDRICGNDYERLRTYYYNCMPFQSNPPTAAESRMYAQMNKFIYNLNRLNRFEVRLGRLQKIGRTYKQKRVDVLLSVDLVRMSWNHQINKAVLLTGDSDFVPAIKAAKDAGVLTVAFYSRGAPQVYAHDELLYECDERFEMTQELINSVTR